MYDSEIYLMTMEEMTEGYPCRMVDLKREINSRGGFFNMKEFRVVTNSVWTTSYISTIRWEQWFVKNRKQRWMVHRDWRVIDILLMAHKQFPNGIDIMELLKRTRAYDRGHVSNMAEQLGMYLNDTNEYLTRNDEETGGVWLARAGGIIREPLKFALDLMESGTAITFGELAEYMDREGYKAPTEKLVHWVLDTKAEEKGFSWRRIDKELEAEELTGMRYRG